MKYSRMLKTLGKELDTPEININIAHRLYVDEKREKSKRNRAPGFLPCSVRKDGCDLEAFHFSSPCHLYPPPTHSPIMLLPALFMLQKRQEDQIR